MATEPVVRAALADGKQVAVPVVVAAGRRLRFALIEDYDRELRPGYRGILEPGPEARRLVDAGRIDCYIIPGVAFDFRGFRLGRGLGYYDRALAGVKGPPAPVRPAGGGRTERPTICALAYELQVVERLPVESHDVPVDYIVTEKRVIECKGGLKKQKRIRKEKAD